MHKNIPTMIGALVTAWSGVSILAQQLPTAPEANGLHPRTATIYVNRQTTNVVTLNNNNTESLGVAIARNGNVILGWEDDGDGLEDLEAVWTMFNSTGSWLSPATKQTAAQAPGLSITNRFLSYFRADGTALPGATSWGPKIHANAYGDGVGMGGTSFGLSAEITYLAGLDDANKGDAPTVQLLTNDGKPVRILPGISDEYATRDEGNIRIGDWEYLSNGNIVIVGESRQKADLTAIYGGTTEENHAVFRVLDPTGKVLKTETLVSAIPEKSEMWHGAASIKGGFAVRFASAAGTATVRMFDNAGNPTSTNLDLAAITGHPEAGGGGRGDGAGFHGNGNDAYVAVSAGGTDIWVTVLNADGSVRYSKTVADDLALTGTGRADAAIDAEGNVVVVFEAKVNSDSANAIMGRRFDSTGKPLSGSFYVSEKEVPGVATGAAEGPRVAWRNGLVAVVWESKNDTETINPEDGTPKTVVALRIFSIAPKRDYSVGLSFGADEVNGAGTATLKTSDIAGVVPQANWNNLSLLKGTNSSVVADVQGTAEPTSVNVTWTCANTWSSTGRGEENNGFATNSADRVLLTGYLDTGGATTSRVSIASIPNQLTTNGYDLYIYALGGVGGRGGSYRLIDADSGKVIRDFVRAQSGTNLTDYVEVTQNLGATAGTGNRTSGLIFGAGNYLVFRGLQTANIIVEARTAATGGGIGLSGTPRAPINAIQLVTPATAPLSHDVTLPGDTIVSSQSNDRSPAAEQVINAIDNNLLTKYLNFGADTDQAAPFVGPVGFTVTPSAGASVVTGIALTSANDSPERDPASYRVEGSNDGTSFTLISEGTVPPFSARFVRQELSFSSPASASYKIFRVTFPTVLDATTANSMQIAEVELIGTSVAAPPAKQIAVSVSGGKLTITYQGTLLSAEKVGGPYSPVAGAASPYSATPDSAAKFFIAN